MTESDGMYYEIEYDATPMPGVGKFVQKTQKLQASEKDEARELFGRMRDIARNNRVLVFGNSRFYNRRVQQENSKIFYKQGMFMKDFEDDYGEGVPYKEYYPCYQMMGYRQLRTYFTWRTKVRKGKVEDTSLSYGYLYLYELLNQIGAADPQDGLDRLLFFRREFSAFQPDINKYIPRWLKDYYIYYDLPGTFSEFVSECGLEELYPELTGAGDRFELFCSVSRYDIRKSVFYSEGREPLIRDCFDFTVDRLTSVLGERGLSLEEMIFPSAKSMTAWRPFEDALFYPRRGQRDRRVVITAREVYECSGNQWTYRTSLTAESGRQLAGYLLKQMESALRRAVKYKYKITAGISVLGASTVKLLEEAGISLEQCITDAVTEFYREATKTVVTVDREALAKIRREALQTQERLLVPEEEELSPPREETALAQESHGPGGDMPARTDLQPRETDPWDELRLAYTETELEALRVILQEADIRQFADEHNIMLEVLADGINEKAVDTVGDSLLDEELMIYDDYLEQVREMLK